MNTLGVCLIALVAVAAAAPGYSSGVSQPVYRFAFQFYINTRAPGQPIELTPFLSNNCLRPMAILFNGPPPKPGDSGSARDSELSEQFILTAADRHCWGSSLGSQNCKPGLLPLIYPSIPKPDACFQQ